MATTFVDMVSLDIPSNGNQEQFCVLTGSLFGVDFSNIGSPWH